MADRLKFQEKLNEILKLAMDQGNKMTQGEVETFFEEDALSAEQLNLVSEYLMSQKVEVIGYAGKKAESEIGEKEVSLSSEEQSYVEGYLREIGEMSGKDPQEARLAYYLPKVVEEAMKLHEPGLFIGDIIQEGNISLMLALGESEGADEEAEIQEKVRAGIMVMIESQTETKRRDNKMIERVSELDETIKSMSEEYGRKVAVDEVADKLGISETEVEDILKLAGEEVEDDE